MFSLFDIVQSLFALSKHENEDDSGLSSLSSSSSSTELSITSSSLNHDSDNNNNNTSDNRIIFEAEDVFGRLFQSLTANDMVNSTIHRNMEKIFEGVRHVGSFAHEYNFENVNANGYWTFVRSCTKLANLILERLDDMTVHEDLETLTCTYVRLLKHITSLREITKDGYFDDKFNSPDCQVNQFTYNQVDSRTESDKTLSKPLFVPLPLYSIDVPNEAAINEVQLRRMFAAFGSFWFCRSMKLFFELYMLGVAFFGGLFPFSLRTLWSREYRAALFTKWTSYPSLSYPFNIWDILDYKIISKGVIPLLFLGKQIVATSLEIRPQNSIVYSRDGKDVLVAPIGSNRTLTSVNGKPVKARLIYKSSRNTRKGHLLFHCHGGGWLAHSPDSHENYLRQWVADVDDCTILSVGYSLKQKFPLALQEILDVYLWATSGSPEVTRTLGFKPKKIILCGDSAGANLVLSLLLTLNDLHQRYPADGRIVVPDSIFVLYGAFLLSPLVGPSRVMGAIDPLLSPGVLLTCGGCYGNVAEDKNSDEGGLSLPKWDPCEGVAENVKRLILATYSFVSSVSSSLEEQSISSQPWFICDEKSFQRKLKTLSDCINTPYASPLIYQKFETLSNVKLRILTTEFCPLLDESITLAKLWKGSVKMDVLQDLPHGFLNFTLVSPEAHNGALKSAQQIKEMFQE